MFDLCDLFWLERPAISLWMVMVAMAMRAMAMKAMRAMRATIRRRDNMDGNKAWRRITWVTWHLTLAFLLFQKTPFIEISPDAHFLKIFWTSPQEKSEKFNIESWISESYHGFGYSSILELKDPSILDLKQRFFDKAAKQKAATRIFECLESFPSFLKCFFPVFPCWGYLLRGG